MSLTWYLRRAARMGPAEIAHRMVEQSRRFASRRATYGWSAFAPPPVAGAVLPALRDRLVERAEPALRAAVLAASTAIRAGRFSALGVDWPQRPADDLFPAAVWSLDPVTGEAWPGADRFCFDVPYRHERRLGDVKYLWEFNRLQFLQPLAADFALTHDPAALAAIRRAVDSWSDSCPPFVGLGWSSGIEVALRSISLILTLSFCGEALDDDTRRRILSALRAGEFWLGRYPSRFSSANNHLVAELAAEYLIATVFADADPGARHRAAKAKAGLEREARLQILEDGVGAEQAPTYAAFTAEFILLCAAVGRAASDPFDPVVEARLGAFADFAGWILDGHRADPHIGDDDEGRVITLCLPRETTYVASVASAISAHLGRPAALPAGDATLRDALFGTPERAAPPRGVRAFRHGGYTVVRERRAGHDVQLIMDHAPLGYLSIAAHGHADANSVMLWIDGQPVLVDPGTYLYHSGGAWRDWFRGTRAHNTLNIGGADQSVIAGPFNWSTKANVLDVTVDEGEAWRIDARHDGYRGRFGVDHQRIVRSSNAGFEIVDRLVGASRAAEAEVVLQFAPGLIVAHQGLEATVSSDAGPIARFVFGAPGRVAAASGGERGEGGWVSSAFAHKTPALRLTWTGAVPPEGLMTAVDLL